MRGRKSPYYSERERAALAWTEAVTRLQEGHVPDEVYERVRKHLTEKELADLTLAIVAINGRNRFNIAARRVPGTYQPAKAQELQKKSISNKHPVPGNTRSSGTEAMMNLVVLGATGGTGLQIVRQALHRGHCVTALVRSPDRLKLFGGQITVQQGDLLSSANLQQVIQGHDAVVSGFGPRLPVSKADAHLLRQFADVLTSAMVKSNVRRVVVESVAFLFKDAIFPPAYLLGRLFFRQVVNDASAMERVFAESQLDWTMVRPPELTDMPYTGKYRVRLGHLPLFGFKIARADVADFMIKAAENSSWVGKIAGISN